MSISRRNFVKSTAIAMATAAAAGSIAGMAGCTPKVNEPLNGESVTKTLAVCRFCGCGCGVVVETLKALRGHYYTVLYTKGDLQEQAGKIRRSGLTPLFDETVIVPHKDAETYRDLCGSCGVEPEAFAMVGNSFKSDIAPVLEIGGWGIHVPCALSWAYEDIEEYDHPNLVRLASFRDLAPLLVG